MDIHRPATSYRVINGLSNLRQTSSFYTPGSRIHNIKLSPDGEYLAIGNDNGRLEVLRLEQGETWGTIGRYLTGAAIRALVWHPTMPGTVFAGSANGYIHRITVVVGGVNIIFSSHVSDYVHTMAISPDGRQLIIGHGRHVSLVNNPFPRKTVIGTFLSVPMPHLYESDKRRLIDCMVPVSIFFVDDYTFVVTVFGRSGISVFSRSDVTLLSTIALREGSIIGSSALSPSGECLAVMNMRDGIDWYSLSHKNYISTTTYAVTSRASPRNLLVDLVFIDEDSVAVGNVDGTISIATYGVPEVKLNLKLDRFASVPLQTLTFGISRGKPIILGVVPRTPAASGRGSSPESSLVSICLIDSPAGIGISPVLAAQSANNSQLDFFHNFKIQFFGVSISPLASVLAVMLAVTLSSNLLSTNRSLVARSGKEVSCSVAETIHATHTITKRQTETAFPVVDHATSTCVCTLAGTMTVFDNPVEGTALGPALNFSILRALLSQT